MCVLALGIRHVNRIISTQYYIVCVWPVCLYHIFPQYLINCTIFGEKLLNVKCILVSFTFVRKMSYSKKNSTIYHK
jgi:hypothetical protein